MPFPHNPDPTARPERRTAHSASTRRSLLAGALVAASLVVSACGSSVSHSPSRSPTRILNTGKVATAIEHSSLAQRNEHARVSCPVGVHQQKGLVFSCTALVGRVSTPFVVTELDGSGDVHYEAH